MISRRLLFLFAPFLLTLDHPCGATTAASLADRIDIDGDISEWTADEWVLDASTPLPEGSGDSRWGTGDDIVRVGVTWDARFMYLAVEFNASSSSLLVALGYGPGGLASLDGAGTFRRGIDLPFAANVLVLADAHGVPQLAHVDDRGVMVLLDRAKAPAVVHASIDGSVVLEAAIPWSELSLARPIEFVAAITGGLGTGAGDAAPDPSVALPVSASPSSKTRATLDRWLSIPADGDDNGAADAGVSPRTAVTVRASDDATAARTERARASVRTNPRVFAPDRGEETTFDVAFDDTVGVVYATARVYSVDGSLVRVLYEDAARTVVGTTLAPSPEDRWDGRDANGRVVAGGVYVLSFEWGLARGEHAGRATAGVAVAR